MTILQAIILGIVEGITEFLPISSTGHLILANSLLAIPVTDFIKTFDIAIQSGAILAVLVLYGHRLYNDHDLIKKVIVAFVPTAVIGLLFHDLAKQLLLGNTLIALASMFVGGFFLLIFERWYHGPSLEVAVKETPVTYVQAVLIGLFQSIAIVPGVSRSAATIVGGLILGLPRTQIVEFSFLLAIPTLLAATALDLYKTGGAITHDQLSLLGVGFVVSFVVALIAIRWLLSFIKNHNFNVFGWYRIVAAVAFWYLLFR